MGLIAGVCGWVLLVGLVVRAARRVHGTAAERAAEAAATRRRVDELLAVDARCQLCSPTHAADGEICPACRLLADVFPDPRTEEDR